MKKTRATNTFDKGLIMDLNPIATPNNVLTDCLNGTLITFNGNENVLQNDMGNGRVESAYLPEGYVPLGTTELGGIIYIVSYNPLSNKCQIGSFPSPERNLSSDDEGLSSSAITQTDFIKNENIIQTSKTVELYKNSLNPGDKYIVYCNNNAIPENANTLSGIFNGEEKSNPKIDDNIRYLTVHLVSVGDDGSVTYLDDNTSWYHYKITDKEGKTNTYNYYIKNVENESEMSGDVDANRDITTSTYNVFQAKTSGKLSLLFKLEVIETFSASYNIEPTGTDKDGNIEASIVFNTNWTSRSSQINPKYIEFLKSDRTSPDQSSPQTGDSQEIILIKTERKNDGTDEGVDVTFKGLTYLPKPTESDIWDFSIIPVMEFGKMNYLPVSYRIDLSKLGTGEITLDEWKYYVNKNKSGEKESILLKWGMSAYLEKNKTISDVTFSFIPFDEIPDKDDEIKWENYPTYINNTEKSYSGNFNLKIQFSNDYKITNGFLEKNTLYLVRIKVNYTSDPRYFYRWIYTTGIFNEKFLNNDLNDFNSIYLNEVLTPKFEISTEDSINPITFTQNPGLIVDKNDNPTAYSYMGLQTTTVGFRASQFDNADKIKITINPTFNDSFFSMNNSTLEYNIGTIEKNITHSDFIVEADKSSKIQEEIKPIFGTDAIDPKLIQQAISDTQVTEDKSNVYKDAFDAEKFSQINNVFNIAFKGAIFTRINADLAKKTVEVDQLLRPILSYESDYKDLGFQLDGKNLMYYFKECHWDSKGSQPFKFYFSQHTRQDVDADSKVQEASTNKDYWNQGDRYTASTYWDGKTKPYDEWLNTWMLNYSGPFQLVYHGKSEDPRDDESIEAKYCGQKSKFPDPNLQGSYILWVKTSSDHYYPINSRVSSTSKISDMIKALKLFLMQIYYVDKDPSNTEKYIVDNINYLNKYTETWTVNTEVTIKTNTINSSILIGGISLNDLKLKKLPDDVSTYNISYCENNEFETTKEISISHTFKINSDILYEIYNDNKVTLIPSVYRLCTEENDIISNVSFDLNCIYLYQNGSFVKVENAYSYKIYIDGEIENVSMGPNVTRLILTPKSDPVYSELLHCLEYKNNSVCFSEEKLLKSYIELYYHSKDDGGADFAKGASYIPFINGVKLWT